MKKDKVTIETPQEALPEAGASETGHRFLLYNRIHCLRDANFAFH